MVKRGAADAPPAVAEAHFRRMLLGGTEHSANKRLPTVLGDITYGTDASYDAVWIGAKMLSSNFVDTFPTLAQLMSNAALPASRFTKQKDGLLDEISEGPGDATAALMQVIHATLYPPTHPFHVSVTGDESSVRLATLDGVARFYRKRSSPIKLPSWSPAMSAHRPSSRSRARRSGGRGKGSNARSRTIRNPPRSSHAS